MNAVIDVSFAGGWFLADESTAENRAALASYERGGLQLEVPQLWSYELPNTLLMAHRRKRLDQTQYAAAQEAFAAMNFSYHEQTDAVCQRRIFVFAENFGLTAYDAAYLELADRLQLPLLTNDQPLQAAAKKRGLPISINLSK